MSNVTTERRRSTRMPAAYPVVLYDRRGLLMCRGRTANISESGVMVIVAFRRGMAVDMRLILELTVPSASNSRRDESRRVTYRCRVARIQAIGQLLGLGVEFVEKIA